MKDAE